MVFALCPPGQPPEFSMQLAASGADKPTNADIQIQSPHSKPGLLIAASRIRSHRCGKEIRQMRTQPVAVTWEWHRQINPIARRPLPGVKRTIRGSVSATRYFRRDELAIQLVRTCCALRGYGSRGALMCAIRKTHSESEVLGRREPTWLPHPLLRRGPS